MTLAEMLRDSERVYWQDLLTRLPKVVAAARVANVDRVTLRACLRRLGLDLRSIQPPNTPIADHEIGLTRRYFLICRERTFWMRLLSRYRDGARVAQVAGVHRMTIYKRFKACGLSTHIIRHLLARKIEHGNEAWQSLATEARVMKSSNMRLYA